MLIQIRFHLLFPLFFSESGIYRSMYLVFFLDLYVLPSPRSFMENYLRMECTKMMYRQSQREITLN